ncbi:unnamed protein product [Rotaria magnacalcarata]|uniref:Peptidase C1A papain C-terminal domain-containing protein n=1 Tax=Rotaria magnacalcarata TaxID=392030 RepID=A0A8S2XHS9_9BILA|nr:unnamed protein product [Rotaria magnacalcarata]CAF4498211.1 unnamed protein product [Rotaria magnacalcarata]CAF4517706.1 unnamed protein product [Rotaria magnacalcarata]
MSKKHFVQNKTTTKKYRVEVDEEEPASWDSGEELKGKFSDHIRKQSEELPHRVDMRKQMTSVENQNPLGSCLACAVTGKYEFYYRVLHKYLISGILEWLLKNQNGEDIDVSPLFIYYNARKQALKEGEKLKDNGSSIGCTLQTLNQIGVCKDETWKYDTKKAQVRPTEQAYMEATNNKIIRALEVNVDLIEMKTCLAQGYPFLFSLRLFKSFFGTGKDGVIKSPKPSDKDATKHNRHAMVAVGYTNKTQEFIVRNSWGEKWGDEGYCYIKYDYMTDPKLCFYAWTIQTMETSMISLQFGSDDDSEDLHGEDEDDDNDDDFTDSDEDESEGEEEEATGEAQSEEATGETQSEEENSQQEEEEENE